VSSSYGNRTAASDGSSRFKNQGDCASFVATAGKNLPAVR
jgi:hypothetical protein